MLAQNIDLKANIYYNPWQPYLAYWSIAWLTIIILLKGMTVFWNFNASDFITACTLSLFLYHTD